MIIKKDNLDSRNTIYECDRCKRRTDKMGIARIFTCIEYIGEKTPIKKYDLCLKCYKAMNIGIKRGVNKNGDKPV